MLVIILMVLAAVLQLPLMMLGVLAGDMVLFLTGGALFAVTLIAGALMLGESDS